MGPTVDTKTYIFPIFTSNIWSYSLWSPVLVNTNMLTVDTVALLETVAARTGPSAVSRVHDGAHHEPRNAAAIKVVQRSRHEGGFAGNQDGVGDVGPARSGEASPCCFSSPRSFSIITVTPSASRLILILSSVWIPIPIGGCSSRAKRADILPFLEAPDPVTRPRIARASISRCGTPCSDLNDVIVHPEGSYTELEHLLMRLGLVTEIRPHASLDYDEDALWQTVGMEEEAEEKARRSDRTLDYACSWYCYFCC